MMATAAITAAGGKPDGDKKDEATAAVPSPVQAGSSWPRALTIDVELAENHARRTRAAGGLGRIDEKNHPKAVSKQSRQLHRQERSLAESCGGGDDDKTRKEGVAGPGVGVGLEESHDARAEGIPVSATGGIARLRGLLENRRRAGVITRSTGRRSTARGSNVPRSVVIDGEDKNMAPGDGVPQTPGGAGGGSANGEKADDGTRRKRGAARRISNSVERYRWPDQEEAAMAGGGEVSTSAGTSSESREDQGRIKRLRRGGVTEAGREKVNDDDSSRTHLELSPPPSCYHHQLGPRIGINNEEVQRHQHHQQPQLVGPTTMDEVAALMSQALATEAMASAISVAAESAPITTTDVKTPLAPRPARRATAAVTAPSKNTATATIPPQPQEHNSSSAFREANAAYVELRNFANKVDVRCAAAIKALHAASRAVAGPREELNRSYDAYCHAYRSLQAAEVYVRDAEEQEDAVMNELCRAAVVVEAAEVGVARAAKALRVFDAGRGRIPSENDTAKEEQNRGDDDDDDSGYDGSDREGAPPPALSAEHNRLQNSAARKHNKSGRTRESLVAALKTAGSNADQALAEQYRVQDEAIAVMTLVGARTAGEWSLAAEACDPAQKRFQRAGLEAIPKIKQFSEQARLFRNLYKLRRDTRQRLSVASQAREAARIAAAEAVAVAVAFRMSAPVATAVAVKAAAEAAARAAARSGGGGENASLPAPVVKQEEQDVENEENEEDGKKEEVDNKKEEEEEGTARWVLPATPWVLNEEQGGRKKGGA